MAWLRFLAPLVSLLPLACSPDPQPATPAFWEVTGPDGQQGWLLGTIHSLDGPADWRSPAIDSALNRADVIVVEVAGLDDQAAMGRTFARLATTEGLPPLSKRVSPELQDQLLAVLESHDLDDNDFGDTETWAAALTIAQAETRDLDSEYGIDRAVISAANERPVTELEGAAAQLALFDKLPAAEQQDLLEAIVRDADALGGEDKRLVNAWRKGDMEAITRESGRGLLADPELREALFTGRNRRWTGRIAANLDAGKHPFVAVGAAHMAGPDGLPAMLKKRGYSVRRVQ